MVPDDRKACREKPLELCKGPQKIWGVILRFWRHACRRYAANTGRNTEES